MRGLIGSAAVCVVAACVPAFAHHSLSYYDVWTYQTVDGTVKSFEWTNPHARLILVVVDAHGRTVNWNLEGPSTGRLSSGGFKKDAIASGDRIKVAYNPGRDSGAADISSRSPRPMAPPTSPINTSSSTKRRVGNNGSAFGVQYGSLGAAYPDSPICNWQTVSQAVE